MQLRNENKRLQVCEESSVQSMCVVSEWTTVCQMVRGPCHVCLCSSAAMWKPLSCSNVSCCIPVKEVCVCLCLAAQKPEPDGCF